jgi:coenzyme PQQ precursor peptide PqqA
LRGRRSGAGSIAMKKWVKPRIVEIAIGLEINAYACAEVG